jgi:two-component system cell cycle sensor histidine kinase PleC
LVFFAHRAIATVKLETELEERKRAESELRKAKEEAEDANKAKSTFLSNISHELRTPLNAIVGFSEVLSSEFFGKLGSQKYVEYAGDIHASSQHLLNLINEILDLSAIESGQQSLTFSPLNVMEIITECSPIVMLGANEKNITYQVDVADDIPPLNADRQALKQIFLNILGNAIKFTPTGGVIKLNTEISDNWQIIKVNNTGAVIPSQKLTQITEPFVRGDSDTELKQEGTGLGLAIVKALMEAHDGTLTIESDASEGTTVSVAFPMPPND